MQVVEISGPGGPEVLRLAQRPVPEPGAGEVLIRVHASGVNRPDVLQRQGVYPPPPGASDIPGLEVGGVLVAGDTQALAQAGLALGDAVCALVAGGGYAQYVVAPVGTCLPVPAGLSLVHAAALPETAFTVWSNMVQRGSLSAGETVLVHGGSSGIGVMAIQVAKALGARVLVTAGTSAKCVACLALGADAAIDYKTQDFEAQVLQLTDGQGVDVVLDMVAGDYVAKELRCLREDGRLVIIAVQGGVHSALHAGVLMRKRLTVTGSTLRPRAVAFKVALAQQVRQQLWPWLSQGRVKVVVNREFAASEAALAHAWMESGQHVGKIVLTWESA